VLCCWEQLWVGLAAVKKRYLVRAAQQRIDNMAPNELRPANYEKFESTGVVYEAGGPPLLMG
jgi:hypothetical protein